MMFIRHFTETDWYAYAGATPFDDGFDPFIAEFKLRDGTEVEVIADQKGYELFLSHKAYGFTVNVPFFDSVMSQKVLVTVVEEFKLAEDEKHLTTSLIAEGWERLV